MTRPAAFRLAAFIALALGLAACGVNSTLVEGWKYAKAVEANLEGETGVRPSVGFNWQNGRLLTVSVTYPQLYERKPLAALAEIVRRSVESHLKQQPEDIVLSFSLGRSGSGTVAQLDGANRNGRIGEQGVAHGRSVQSSLGNLSLTKLAAGSIRRRSGDSAMNSASRSTTGNVVTV